MDPTPGPNKKIQVSVKLGIRSSAGNILAYYDLLCVEISHDTSEFTSFSPAL